MSGILAAVGLVVLVVGMASGCDLARTTPTSVVPPTPAVTGTPTVPGEPTPTPAVELPAQILAARDAALVFLRERYAGKAPPEGVAWTGRVTTPPGVVGVATYEFSGESWVMTVAALAVSPTQVLYELGLDNLQTGLHWTGSLDEAYNLLGSNLNVAVEVLVTREIVLAHVRASYPEQAPAGSVVWIGERTTLAGLVGHETCQFTSLGSAWSAPGDWTMTVDYDVVRPDQVLYEVDLRRASSGFVWRGKVNAEGTVLEHR